MKKYIRDFLDDNDLQISKEALEVLDNMPRDGRILNVYVLERAEKLMSKNKRKRIMKKDILRAALKQAKYRLKEKKKENKRENKLIEKAGKAKTLKAYAKVFEKEFDDITYEGILSWAEDYYELDKTPRTTRELVKISGKPESKILEDFYHVDIVEYAREKDYQEGLRRQKDLEETIEKLNRDLKREIKRRK
jgi:histone H3/H4